MLIESRTDHRMHPQRSESSRGIFSFSDSTDQFQTIGLPDMRELKAAKARSVVSRAGLFVSSPISKRHQFLLTIPSLPFQDMEGKWSRFLVWAKSVISFKP
jgi:hypothetical protein